MLIIYELFFQEILKWGCVFIFMSIHVVPIPSVSWDITVSPFWIGVCGIACVQKPFPFTSGLVLRSLFHSLRDLVLCCHLSFYIHFFLLSLQFPLFILIGKLSLRKIPDVHIEFCWHLLSAASTNAVSGNDCKTDFIISWVSSIKTSDHIFLWLLKVYY